MIGELRIALLARLSAIVAGQAAPDGELFVTTPQAVKETYPERVDQMRGGFPRLYLKTAGMFVDQRGGTAMARRHRMVSFDVWAWGATPVQLEQVIEDVAATVEVRQSLYGSIGGLMLDKPTIASIDHYVIDEETRNSGPYAAAIQIDFSCETDAGVL